MYNLKDVKRIVVKVGTSTLTYDNGCLNLRFIDRLAKVLSSIKNSGRQVVLVTSGSVAVGVKRLGLNQRPDDLKGKQAAAAVGQSQLMHIYDKFFSEYNQIVAQILLTKDVLDNEHLGHNVINTFEKLFELNVIPIVNENDTISTYELEAMNSFGENDTLAAIVSTVIKADLVVLLSDIDGLYDKNPKLYSDAELIPVVKEINCEIKGCAGGPDSPLGTGGMATKLEAAEIATGNKVNLIIAQGKEPEILYNIFDNKPIGTIFLAKE